MTGIRLTDSMAVVWAIAAVALVLAACERPFVEPNKPSLEILEPDFSSVALDPSVTIIVRADAFRSVEDVSVDGQPLQFDSVNDVWTVQLELQMGLNRLVFSVTDVDGQVEHDTTFALHLLPQISRSAPILPDSRGGHTATALRDGSIVVIGGAATIGSPVRNDGAILRQEAARFTTIDGRLRDARAGHTATLLPDGRVLIMGGSRSVSINSASDLIETVEIYDAETDRFASVPVAGAPIRRTYHTAVLRRSGDDLIVDLFGGTGDVQYEPSPLLGIRRDIRSFSLRNDSLFALNPAPGPSLEFALSGHSQTPLTDQEPDETRPFLLVGTRFETGLEQNVAAIVDYAAPGGLQFHPTGKMLLPRTRHAAELLAPGVVVVFGGHQGSLSTVLPNVEFYITAAGRFFEYPLSSVVQRRFGLTATKSSAQRILLLGGFGPGGDGVTLSETFSVPSL